MEAGSQAEWEEREAVVWVQWGEAEWGEAERELPLRRHLFPRIFAHLLLFLHLLPIILLLFAEEGALSTPRLPLGRR